MEEGLDERTTYTHCHLCEQFCGLAVTVRDGQIASIRPDKANPYSWRDFCVKAQRAGDVVHSPWRITSPMRREGARYVAATYEEAVADIAAKLKVIISRDGPDAVAGYVGNPGGFNAGSGMFHNAFLKALGTHQQFSMFSVDTNAYHVAVEAMFGAEWMTLIPDIDATDCALLIGTNPAISKLCWLGTVPNGWRRLMDRVRSGADLIVVDPRRTETAEKATLFLAPRPESDWALLLAMLHEIFRNGWERTPEPGSVAGLETLRTLALTAKPLELAAICDVPLDRIQEAARRFAGAERAFAFAATGPGLGRNGVVAHWLAMALNVVTARLDTPGGRFMPNWPLSMGVFTATAAPNPRVLSRVRRIPSVIGYHSIAELADEIVTPGAGQVKALFITGGNPVATGAGGDRLSEAMNQLELLVAVDLFQRESHRNADWLIPGQHFLERDELSLGCANFERPFAMSARAALLSPGTIRPEWTFFRDLAAEMGVTLFDGDVAPDVDSVTASMLGYGGMITLEQIRAAEHGIEYAPRTMGHMWNYLADAGRAIDVAPPLFVARVRELLALPQRETASAGLQMISRRRNNMMNSWLAETSGSLLNDETCDSVEVNRSDAEALGFENGQLVRLTTCAAEIVARVRVSDEIRAGAVVLVHGWGTPLFDAVTGKEVFRKGVDRNKLVSDRDLDPLSGVPRLNGTHVQLSALDV